MHKLSHTIRYSYTAIHTQVHTHMIYMHIRIQTHELVLVYGCMRCTPAILCHLILMSHRPFLFDSLFIIIIKLSIVAQTGNNVAFLLFNYTSCHVTSKDNNYSRTGPSSNALDRTSHQKNISASKKATMFPRQQFLW
jgi:hypothetical protein